MSQSYVVFIALHLLVAVTGMIKADRRVQAVLPVVDFALNVSYLSFTTLSVIAR